MHMKKTLIKLALAVVVLESLTVGAADSAPELYLRIPMKPDTDSDPCRTAFR